MFRCLIQEIIFVEAMVDFFSHGEFVCFECQERSKSKPNWSGKFKAKILAMANIVVPHFYHFYRCRL